MNVNDCFRFLTIGLPEDIRRRADWGDISGAVRLIDRRLGEDPPEALRASLTARREMLLRLPGDFPYTREQALAVVREKVPGFTGEEFDQLTDAGQIRWIYLDGQPRYFDRFFASMCKSMPDFARRARAELPGAESAAAGSAGADRLDRCVGRMKERGEMRCRIRVRASLRLNDRNFVPGMFLRAHLPIPADCEEQTDIAIEEMRPSAGVPAPGDAPQRTVCWEGTFRENPEFSVVYSYTRTARYRDIYGQGYGKEGCGDAKAERRLSFRGQEDYGGNAEAGRQQDFCGQEKCGGNAKAERRLSFRGQEDCGDGAEAGPHRNFCGQEDRGEGRPLPFTGEEPPHLVFTPLVRSLADRLAGGVRDPLEKARRFYDYITLNMKYTYMPAYFSMENIPDNCILSKTGDCGVFALLFITLCRCAGIPARWQSGLAAEPDFCGAHDWARFYAEPYGWIFADPSYGISAVRAGNEERRRFYFGNLDPYRMAANSAFQAPFIPRKEQWRADPYDNQVGELETAERGMGYGDFVRNKEVLLCQEL